MTTVAGRGGLDLDSPPLRPPMTVKRVAFHGLAVLAVVGAYWGITRVELSPTAIIDGWPETQALLERMWPPTIPAEDSGQITRAVFDTFFMAFAGTAIGVALAMPLAFLAADNVMRLAPVRYLARAVIVFTRAVPTIVFAMVFVRVYGIGVLPGILAIGLHSIGMIAKLMADAIEDIDPGPRDGVLSTGAGRFQELVAGVWTQLTPTAIAVSLYRLEIDFRSAPILGFVGAGGIGVILRGYQGNLRYQELLGATLLIVVLVVAMEFLSAVTRRAILGTDGSAAAGIGGSDTGSDDVSLSAPWTRQRVKLAVAGWATSALFIASFLVPDISFSEAVGSIGNLPDIAWRLVPKDMSWLTANVVDDLVETVAIGAAATAIALVVAVPLAFLAAGNTTPGRWVYRMTRLSALLLRAAPELVVAVILVAAIGLGPAAGTLALAIGLVGFATKLFADNIEEVRQGPRDGVSATGAGDVQEITTGVIPQVLPGMVSNGLYLFDISLRSSTILGIVGAGGIGFLLNNAAKTLNFDVMGGIILSIFVIVYAIELLAGAIRRQII